MQRLAELCIRRPVFATMLVMALVVGGVFSYLGLGVDLYPDVNFPAVTVTTVDLGASALEIESSITEKVESAVNTVSGIDTLTSTTVEGVSIVVVMFVLEKDANLAAQEVESAVNGITDLPSTAQRPTVEKLDVSAAPILQFALSSDTAALHEVTSVAKDSVKERLEQISGVGRVDVVGGTEQVVDVAADPTKLEAFAVTMSEIATAIQLGDMEIPGGRVTRGATELTVRTLGKIDSLDELRALPVAFRGQSSVRLGDVATISVADKEQRTLSLLDGKPAVTIQVVKQSGTNTSSVAGGVKAELAAIEATLPEGMSFDIVVDQSLYVEAAIDTIKEHLLLGGLFASIVVFFFLGNARSTIIAALAIPTSLVSTFILMSLAGYTLNQITMLALALMVGIVIDDAIVVLENIFRWVDEKGLSPMQAAVEGTREIGLAVMATTLSLLAVFVPVGFMKGIVGRFMGSFGMTSAFAIAVSLLVSFTLTPMLCARLLPRGEGPAEEATGSRFYQHLEATYLRMLDWSMHHRAAIVGICVIVVLSTVPITMALGKDFTPEEDQSEFQVLIETEVGSTLDGTAAVASRVATELRSLPGARSTLVTIGGGSDQAVDSASIYVQLVPIDERDLGQEQIMARGRDVLKRFGELRSSSVEASSPLGGGGGRTAAITYVVKGPDLDKLAAISNQVTGLLEKIPGAVDVDTSLGTPKPELRVEIDRERAADLGVSAEGISRAVNLQLSGQTVATYGDVDVDLRAAGDFQRDPSGIANLVVPSSTLGLVTLDQVASVVEATGPAKIVRGGRQREVEIYADLAPGYSQSQVLGQLAPAVATLDLEDGYSVGPVGTSQQMAEAGVYFLLSFALSFIFMYMVLAAQFESFVKPLVILSTLPLAVPFGFLSLLVFGQHINLFSGLGLLLLFGIVKKNAILQIDHTHALIASGVERHEATMQANRDRLRPILMTTLALVAGMLPLALSSGVGSGGNRSIGVLVLGGQLLCLLITLLAVPVLDSLADDFSRLPIWSRFVRRLGFGAGDEHTVKSVREGTTTQEEQHG